MSEESRTSLLGLLWIISAFTLGAIFIGSAVLGELTSWHVIFAFTVLGIATTGTFTLLRLKDDNIQYEKAKREDLDSMLGNLSDDELKALKRRLSDVDDENQSLIDYLGDDGEFVARG